MNITQRFLPPICYSKSSITEVKGSVNHYFSAVNIDKDKAFDIDTCYALLEDLNTRIPREYASYTYLIDRKGGVWQLAPDGQKTYHAGVSTWKGFSNLNAYTIGIAWLGTHTSGFTDAQYAAGAHLHAQLMTRYGFGLEWVTRHDRVSPGRKKDPGPLFDEEKLYAPLRSIII